MKVTIIVAMSENRGIGKNNRVPWRLRDDLKMFKRVTMGHHLIMGRKTYESIGKPLPGRQTMILTRNSAYTAPDCDVVHTLANALALAKTRGESETFVIGGAEIYALALPHTHRMILTRVHARVPADTFFPAYAERNWVRQTTESFPANTHNEYPFTIETYQKVEPTMSDLTPFTESITFLYTLNLKETAAFYEGVLGLKIVVDQGDCRIYRVSGESFLGVCQRKNAPDQPEGVIFTFVTEDVDGWAARLSAAGAEMVKAPQLYAKYQIYNCFFHDPNGYLIEIQRFLDPMWKTGE
jgi:dihydrofolate reductase